MTQSWSRLPRVAKWGVLALVLIAAYFLVIEKAIDATNQLSSRADAIESALRREKELSSSDAGDGQLLAQGERLFGKPLLPSDPSARPETLYRVVNAILTHHAIQDASVNERAVSSQLRPEQTASLTDMSHSVERFALEVSFESDPKTAASIIADMEKAPEVTSVGRVRIEKFSARNGSKDTDQNLRVTVSPEIWVLLDSFANTGGGGSQ